MSNVDISRVKVGVVQLETQINNFDRNIKQAMQMVDECVNEQCKLVCLPEAFSTSINLPKAKEVAEEIPGKTSELLCQKAKEKQIYIIAGILEKENDDVYSSAILIDPEGNIKGLYRRVHTYRLEKRFIKAGNSFKVFETSIGRIGIIIGYDINFPESCRVLFRQKVELIVCPTQLLRNFAPAVNILALARAAENGCYFIMASSIGENTLARFKYMGNSLISRNPIVLDPHSTAYTKQNEIIAKADMEETILYGKLNLKSLRRDQEENPHYKDALPMSYASHQGGVAVEKS